MTTTPPVVEETTSGGFPPPPPPSPGRPSHRRSVLIGFFGGVVVAALGALAIAGWTRDTSPNSPPAVASASAPATTSAGTQPPAASTSKTDVSGLVSSVKDGIVRLTVTAVTDGSNGPFGGGGSQTVAGSGFVFDANGLIATNAHVVDGATAIKVEFSDGSTKDGTVLGIDHSDDLAVVKVDATGLHALPIGDSSTLQVGQRVVAIGNALDLSGGPTVTEGIVSGLDRSIDTNTGTHLTGMIQTDAPINHGNSGGPLFDLSGKVVGINSAGDDSAQNVGFAIAISQAKPILDQLAQGKTVSRPFLGVTTQTVDAQLAQQYGLPVDHGVVIVSVNAGSPADSAGLRRGDVVTEINGKAVDDTDAFGEAVRSTGSGNEFKMTVARGKQTLTISATLGSRTA